MTSFLNGPFIENGDVKWIICDRKLLKKENVQKLSAKGWGNLIAISKLWTKRKPIDDEYRNLTVVYKELKNVEKPCGKVLNNCRTLISTKRNTFRERYNKSNDQGFNHEH